MLRLLKIINGRVTDKDLFECNATIQKNHLLPESWYDYARREWVLWSLPRLEYV